MATEIRPELSEKNPYWIGKHRYYELKHFCLQYPIWRKSYAMLDGFPSSWPKLISPGRTNNISDPVAKCAMARLFYSNRMDMIERMAKEADEELSCYILKGVTEGASYDYMRIKFSIPCCKDTYYDLYRRFFWLLSQERG